MKIWIIIIFFFSFGFATVVKADVNGFGFMSIDLEVTEEPSLHMHSNIDFSDKIALCIQLTQPKSLLRHFVTKHLHVPKLDSDFSSFNSSSTLERTFLVPGLTHVLNKKNNDMCNIILT